MEPPEARVPFGQEQAERSFYWLMAPTGWQLSPRLPAVAASICWIAPWNKDGHGRFTSIQLQVQLCYYATKVTCLLSIHRAKAVKMRKPPTFKSWLYVLDLWPLQSKEVAMAFTTKTSWSPQFKEDFPRKVLFTCLIFFGAQKKGRSRKREKEKLLLPRVASSSWTFGWGSPACLIFYIKEGYYGLTLECVFGRWGMKLFCLVVIKKKMLVGGSDTVHLCCLSKKQTTCILSQSILYF